MSEPDQKVDDNGIEHVHGGRSEARGEQQPAGRERTELKQAEVCLEEPMLLAVAPVWTRTVLLLTVFALVGLLALCAFGTVDQTARARGVLRVTGGAHQLAAQASGLVDTVSVRTGQVVSAGDILVVLNVSATRVALAAADAELEIAENKLTHLTSHRKALFEKRTALLRERERLLGLRAKSQEAVARGLEEKVRTFERLAREGVASSLDKLQAQLELAHAESDLVRTREDLATARSEVVNLSADLDAEQVRLSSEVETARGKRKALAFAIAQAEIRAPSSGRIDMVLVKPGDTVTPGTSIARLVPDPASVQILVFVPERERAFLDVGATARVDFDQFPATEFGFLDARVTNVGGDIASTIELEEALGPQPGTPEPSYRVELTLVPRQETRLERLVRPGSLLSARILLRQQRLAALLLEPARRWLEGRP